MAGSRRAFTLLELLVAMVILGVLASIVTHNWHRLVQKARVANATSEIRGIQQDITVYQVTRNTLPPDLAAVGWAGELDPWGHPYVYVPLVGARKSAARKDRFLVPLNSDYDLYSNGADGESRAPLTAQASRDDVVRAIDGGFIGLASEF